MPLLFLGCTSRLRAKVGDGLVGPPRGAQPVGVGYRVHWPKLPNFREGTGLCLQHLMGMSSPVRQPDLTNSLGSDWFFFLKRQDSGFDMSV